MIEETIKKAVDYAHLHLGLRKDDEVYFTNLLLAHFGAKVPFAGEVDTNALAEAEVPDLIIEEIVRYDTIVKGMDEATAERDATWVMGVLTPRPSFVNDAFNILYGSSPKAATDYLYSLSVLNNYVQKSKVDKNIRWLAEFDVGTPLEISINLSKPEKFNKDIAKLVGAKASGYPACLLCYENVGFEGDATHPARENIRFVPVTLDGEQWYLQFSPYGYYDQHCIVFYEKHVPMAINDHIFRCLFDFVDQFPHYFMGSNSDLPIVGGSILNHEHFQGGLHEMPMMKAPIRQKIELPEAKSTQMAIMDFYDTVVKLWGSSREEIIAFATKITKAWRSHDDLARDIIAEENGVQHSTVTPIVRKVGDVYEMFLILRNNRCNDKFPDGIFHVHPEYQYIKQEGIGLIEAAGLFILPPRLVRQGQEAADVVRRNLTNEETLKLYPDLKDFGPLIADLKRNVTFKQHVSLVCQEILGNVAVYKKKDEDQAALKAFLEGAIQ
jgi:UDPglucose--hexose-1-phosphate uridylyltransferase